MPANRFHPRMVALGNHAIGERISGHDDEQWGQLLIGTNPNGRKSSSIDEPDYSGGPLRVNPNPRTNGNNYFDAAAFSENALGTPGTAKRRFFHGPGADNYDVALAKSLRIAESKVVLFRVEAFNVFNHAQFNGPGAIDGNIGSRHSAMRSARRRRGFFRER